MQKKNNLIQGYTKGIFLLTSYVVLDDNFRRLFYLFQICMCFLLNLMSLVQLKKKIGQQVKKCVLFYLMFLVNVP